MYGAITQILKNYDLKTGLTEVDLPSTLALHQGIKVFVFLGYLTPVSNEWNWSYGCLSFRMTRRSFRELRSHATKKKLCFRHA